jgi:hypothetical protein
VNQWSSKPEWTKFKKSITLKARGEKIMKWNSFCFRGRIGYLILTMALVSLLVGGCEKKSTKETPEAPRVARIKSLTIVPPVVQKGRTSVVDAVVEDDANRPFSGIRVTFTVSPANIGYCSPPVDTTDANGSAGSVFTATGYGIALVQATIEDATPKTAQVEVVTSGEPTKPLSVEITPAVLPADGISSSKVRVIVSDTTGNLAKDSTVVKFTVGEKFEDVDGDGYFTEGIDNLKYDANQDGRWNSMGFIPPYAYSNSGEVTVTYVAGLHTGTAYVKITSSVDGYLIQDDATLLLIPTDSVAYIVLMPDHSQIQVPGTGGVEASQIRAVCYDHYGNRVGEGFPVQFYIISGPGGGESLNGVVSDSITINTNSYGEATVTLLSGTKSGTVRLRAKVGTILSASTLVTICAGPPVDISLSPYYCNIPGCGTECEEDSICACVVDTYGNPVPDSTSVYFGTEEGMVHCCDKTKQGCAYSLYVSCGPRNDCIALVWAETKGENGIISDTCIIILSGPPKSLTFLDYPRTILADGISEGHVLIEVLDANDHFVVGSTPVAMHTVFGSVASGVTKDGCNASLLQTYLTSEVLAQDYSMKYTDRDDSVGVVSLLTAKCGVESTTVTVTFLTGHTYSGNCEISVITVPVGATVPVVVYVKDAFGNPLGGHHIVADQIHSWRGTIIGSAYTNQFGEAFGFFFTGTSVGTGVIAFYDEDPTGDVCIAINVSIVP